MTSDNDRSMGDPLQAAQILLAKASDAWIDAEEAVERAKTRLLIAKDAYHSAWRALQREKLAAQQYGGSSPVQIDGSGSVDG